jgi:hypothetical protein
VYELVGFLGDVRFQFNFTARGALWLGGEIGCAWIPRDVFVTYGLRDSNNLGLAAGGRLGFDWHFLTEHHSFGLTAGARVYPNLRGTDGEIAIGVTGTAYLRYVF